MKDTMKGMYITCANTLGYGDVTRLKTTDPRRKQIITECADGYISATKAGKEEKRSAYISALMLMFYGEIGKMAEKCKAVSEYEYEDFAAKLYECINTACEYAAWKDGKHTAEACIRSVIASRGAPAILYESNLDKNKANVNNYSLDATINDDDGHEVTKLDLTEDDSSEKFKNEINVRLYIQSIINKGDILAGIILDNIAFRTETKETSISKVAIDTEGNEYKYTDVIRSSSENSIVGTLSSLPDTYINYFLTNYSASKEAVEATITRIKEVNSTKLHKFVRIVLEKQRVQLSR